MPGKDLAIVIPVFNEARNVVPIVAALHAALDDTDWEVVFVDDDSPDGTADIVRNLAFQDERVRLILRVKDRGLSQSCIQGLLSTKADEPRLDGRNETGEICTLRTPGQRSHGRRHAALRRRDHGRG